MLALVMGMQALFANEHVKEGYMISGHVIEKATEENIPYATVLIVGTDRGTMSNEAGQFHLARRRVGFGLYSLAD